MEETESSERSYRYADIYFLGIVLVLYGMCSPSLYARSYGIRLLRIN